MKKATTAAKKTKKYYWIISNASKNVFEGSFKDVWSEFVKRYGRFKLSDLNKREILIKRIN